LRYPIALAALAAAALAGCGSGGGDDVQAPKASTPAPVGSVAVSEVKRELAEDFSDGLQRLAEVTQPRDDAVAVGQDLPTGTLTAIACAKPTHCTVRWRTVGGAARTLRYRIRPFQGGCFTARAAPQLANPYDATTGSPVENPLNTFVGATCS
jgi:hypothetical protein